MTCAVPGCGAPLGSGGAKGLCPRHYQAQRRGRPLVGEPMRSAAGEGTELMVRFPRALLEEARGAAEAAGVNVREWVRGAVRQRLEKERPPPAQRWKRP